MPVVAAVERRVELAGQWAVLRAGHRVGKVVRVLLVDRPHDGRRVPTSDVTQHLWSRILAHTIGPFCWWPAGSLAMVEGLDGGVEVVPADVGDHAGDELVA